MPAFNVAVTLASPQSVLTARARRRHVAAAAAVGLVLRPVAAVTRWWRATSIWRAALAGFAWRPSRARIIRLDDFAGPAQRGARATPLPRRWPSHGAGGTLDYALDFGAVIAPVTAAAVTVTPAGLRVVSVLAEGRLLIVWLTGGVAGVDYTVEIGRTWNVSIAIRCI